jgi:hypothetical protein
VPLVQATKLGFYKHRRRREGDVFEMDDAVYSPKGKDGKPLYRKDRDGNNILDKNKKPMPVVCSWVKVVSVKANKAKAALAAAEVDLDAPLEDAGSENQDVDVSDEQSSTGDQEVI